MRVLNDGTRLADRYVLIRRLGEGGMSEIWLARDERAESVVALKFLKPELSAHPGHRERFHKEWRIGSRLMHPHIVRVFEYHDEPDGPYYAMQRIGGPSVSVLANEPLDAAVRPFGLLADALRYAHGKDFVHRDIKASNVLLDERGTPCLLDFGVAAGTGESTTGGGTPVTAAPGAGTVARPSDDVYALGVLLHEIVAGIPPAGAAAGVPGSRPDGTPIPDDLRRLLADMLGADPSSRPAAEAVRDRLAEAGYPPGPAPVRAGRSEPAAAADVRVESIRRARRPGAPTSTAAAGAGRDGGLSPRVVYGAFAVLLLLFVGVIFVLPALVERQRESARSVVDDGAGTVADVPDAGAEPGQELSVEEQRRLRREADDALGDLLGVHEGLKARGIERWGGQPYLDAMQLYRAGDEAYIAKDYGSAAEKYRGTAVLLEPFFDRIDSEFRKALDGAHAAFEAADPVESVRLYDLAVAITPGHPEAEQGLARARNLEAVLNLMDQGLAYEDDLELEAARLAFEKALELDSLWQPAIDALERVRRSGRDLSFDQRMSEGLEALAAGDFATARAAFTAAKGVKPESREAMDGLLQVDQGIKLERIRMLEDEARSQESAEQWETAVATYQALLEVDGDLAFAKEGLARASSRAAVHRQLQEYIDDPDSLSDPAAMQRATRLLLDLTRVEPQGPRLTDQKDELSRLLKRAATPVTVQLVSDNATEVSIYKVGKLGSFASQEITLRPGTYVAVGIRPGYRDVRHEFRVAPEVEAKPVVVMCEERI